MSTLLDVNTPQLLAGKVVIVTGAARGIGRSIARVLGQQGATVAVNYAHSSERAAQVAEEIRTAHGNAAPFEADVRKPDEMESMARAVLESYGRIDGIVNNAIGGKQHGAFDEASLEDYSTAFDFGCTAIVNSIRSLRPIMQQQGGGRIVNIVTELWNMAPGGWSVYMAGKGAMVGISRSLAVELGPDNITVNMVAPGWMADDKVDTESDGSKAFGQSLPLRRHGSADEIGNACAFLLSDLASYITGAYIPVTGGRITQVGM